MFIVNMEFIDMEKLTPELTELHKAYLRKAYHQDGLLIGGPKNPRTGGIIVSNHSSEEPLTELLANDPFVLEGVATFTIMPFTAVTTTDELAFVLDQ